MIFLPINDVEDKVFWALSPDGIYSLKLGAKLLINYKTSSQEKVEFQWIWKSNLPPKIQFFLWKACNDGLPYKGYIRTSSYLHSSIV